MYLHFPAVRSVNQHVINILRQLLNRGIQAELIFLRKCAQNRIGKASLIFTRLPAHDLNGTFVNTELLIRNHQLRIKLHLISKTKTDRTGAKRIIKGKASRFNLRNTDSTIRAGKALAEIDGFPTNYIYH